MSADPLQDIFDRAEELADALAIASGCTSALSVLIDQLRCDLPDLLRQANAVAGAIDMALIAASRHADGIARLTMDRHFRHTVQG